MSATKKRIPAEVVRPPGPVDLHGFDDVLAEAAAAARHCEWCDHAFYYGYQAALRTVYPKLPSGPLALCHSERSGNSPKQLQCKALPGNDGWFLRGHKSFVTSPELCTQVLVSAVAAEDSTGRRDIGVFLVQLNELLVSVQTYPSVSFMPRLGQGEMTLDGVYVSARARMPGDYTSLIRPFGVCETLCCALTLAAMGVGRGQSWGDAQLQDMAAACEEQVLRVARGDCSSPETVLACEQLAQPVAQLQSALLQAVEAYQPERLVDWQRDIRIFGFIGPLWDRRYERARKDLAG